MTKLQIEDYPEEINEILDNFYRTIDVNDKLWKLALNRMDFRKYEIDPLIEPTEKGQVFVKPQIDKDLVDMVNENQKQLEVTNTLLGITNWAQNVFENKEVDDKSFEYWQKQHQSYERICATENNNLDIYKKPTYLAAIGILQYGTFLSNIDRDWCIKIIRSTVEKRIKQNFTNESFPSYIEIEPAIKTLPYILKLPIKENDRKGVKQTIFLSLLFLITHEIEYPFETIRNCLWDIDHEFASACLAGMLEYAKLHKTKIGSFYLQGKQKEEIEKDYQNNVNKLVKKSS